MILKRFAQKDSGKYDRLREFASKKYISELSSTIDQYMKNTINGDQFKNEQDFEDAVRKMLKEKGFKVQEKQNVENAIKEVNERSFSGDVENKIPDIVIECREGLVFLELKFENSPAMYLDDRMKVLDYKKQQKCAAAGVLFLDKKQYHGWERCVANPAYYYYWDLR